MQPPEHRKSTLQTYRPAGEVRGQGSIRVPVAPRQQAECLPIPPPPPTTTPIPFSLLLGLLLVRSLEFKLEKQETQPPTPFFHRQMMQVKHTQAQVCNYLSPRASCHTPGGKKFLHPPLLGLRLYWELLMTSNCSFPELSCFVMKGKQRATTSKPSSV